MKVNNKTESAAPSTRNAPVADRLSDRLATLLCDQISSGSLHVGDCLPTEQQLALRHGVSRTVVREAVHQFESRRIVRVRQGAGVFVSPPMLNSPLEFDPRVLESVQPVVHVVEVRRVHEGEIAVLAAERATRAQIATMRRAMKTIDSATRNGQERVAEDLALHRAIVDTIAARGPVPARRCATEHLVRGEQRLVEGGVILGLRRKSATKRNPVVQRKVKVCVR